MLPSCEPPCADPHAGWCGEGGLITRLYPIHPLLGALPEGALGSATQDGEGPFHPWVTADRSLVPNVSSLAGVGPASGFIPQAEGSLRLLWHHRQWPGAGPFSLRSPAIMAQVVESPLVACPDDMGKVCPFGYALSAPPTACRSQCLPSCSDSVVRGAGCPNRASPDLWEPRVSNRPWLPGRA